MRPATLDDMLDDGELPLAEDLGDAVRAWFAHLTHERGAADNTLDAYERDLRQFLAWLKSDLGHAPCLADLARLDARRFRAFMAAPPPRRPRPAARSRAPCRRCGPSSAGSRPRRSPRTAAVLQVALPKVPHGVPKPLTVREGGGRGRRRHGGRARLDRGARHGRAAAALRLGPAHLRGARPDARRTRRSSGRDVLRVTGKGGKERLVPVLPVTQRGDRRATSRSARTRSSPTARCSSAPRAAR